MRDLDLMDRWSHSPSASPVPVSVAEAILKGAAHNKGLEVMWMRVPHELQELADAVKQENKKLALNVWYCKVRVSLYCLVYECLLLCFVNNCLWSVMESI